MAESVSYIYQIIDKFTPALKRIEQANKRFESGMKKVSAGMGRIGINAGRVKDSMMAFGAAAGAGLVVAAKKSMDFESVMADVSKVMNIASNDPAMIGFKENILKTSVAMGKLPKNIAEIAVAGGKLGIAMKDMDNFIGVVSRTSVAFDMLESTAGEQIGSIQAKLGLTVNETGNLMDAVNYLADNTAAGGARMIDIIARTSGTLKSIDMPRKFMAGWAAFADQMEVTPELAASGLNMMIAKMRHMPGMLELMVKSPQGAIEGLLKSLSGLDAVTRAKQVDKLFGPEAGRFVLKAVNNMKKYDETMRLVVDDTKFAGSMMKELANKLGTSETAWGKIKAIFDVVAITVGDVLTPYIKSAAPKIVNLGFAFRNWAKTHPDMLKLGIAIAAISAAMIPILLIISVIGGPLTAIGIALVSVGAAIFEIQQNWKYLVADFEAFIEWINSIGENVVNKIRSLFGFGEVKLTPEAKKQLETETNVSGAASSFWSQLKKDFGFNKGAETLEVAKKASEKKWAAVKEMRHGVAAQNAAASKSTLNGNIVVSAKPGSKVESAGMQTSAPGNLGFNMMGATP